MSAPGSKAREDEETVDDEFLYHLYRGGELLSSGEIHKAKDELERAFQLRPKNQRGQNLLGLVYFKLGLFDRAEEIYAALVKDNPLDPTLRVNLGLVELKSGRIDAAIKNLQAAVDLAPEHKKASNYLGLALAQSGDYARAREAFLKAGSEAMARKMERAMAGIDPPPTPQSRIRAQGASSLPAVAAGGYDALEDEQPFSPAEIADSERPPNEGWIAAAVSDPGSQATLAGAPRSQTVPEFARVVRIESPRGAPFAVGAEGVRIDFETEIYSRLDGLVAARGAMEAKPVRKRFRGRTTEKSFGEGPRQMWQLSGGGQVLIGPGKPPRVFTTLQLADDAIYLAEEALFAFEESLLFENGRVPGKVADLNLVHVRGTGPLVLATERPIRSLAASGEKPLKVPVQNLVGWSGGLTPRLVVFGEEGAERPLAFVELTGEGEVLLLG